MLDFLSDILTKLSLQGTLYFRTSFTEPWGVQVPAFENVANLDRLPPAGFRVVALPMKIRGGSGGPLRIVAILE